MDRTHLFLSVLLILAAFDTASVSALTATTEPTSLYGYLGYSDSSDFKAEFCRLGPDGISVCWDDPIYADATISLHTGWKRGDRVCGFIPYYYLNELVSVIYVEFDFTTGEVYMFQDQDARQGCYEICAYNSDENMVYGYGFDSTGQWFFMKSPGDRPFDVEYIKKLPVNEENDICAAMTWNPRDKQLYGVNYNNDLVTVSPLGVQRKVMALNKYAQRYITGLCYAPKEDKFYWNGIIKAPGYMTEVSSLYKIDTRNRTFNQIYEYENAEQFMFFTTTDVAVNSEAPAVPQYVSDTFSEGNDSGTVTWRLPDITEGKEALTGELAWTAYVDGARTDSGTALPGSEVTVEYLNLPQAEHLFTFTVAEVLPGGAAGPASESATRKLFTGLDIPASPAGVTLTPELVKWESVITGEHGGYIGNEPVLYKVYLNGAFEGSTRETSMPVALPQNTALTRYTAEVEAVCGSLVSKRAASNPVVAGRALQLDVEIEPTAYQISVMTTADVNGDTFGWFYNAEEGALQSDYSESEPMDDWVFMPAIEFPDPEVLYKLTFSASPALDGYNGERLAVWYGEFPAPEAMTVNIVRKFNPGNKKGYIEYGDYFKIPHASTGYIGFHTASLPEQYGISVKNIKISATEIVPSSPAAVTGLDATPVSGALSAMVSFTMPVRTMGGNPIPASSTLTATVKSGTATATVAGLPGENVCTVVSTESGMNSLMVSVSDGIHIGPDVSVDVYTGADVPAPVENITRTLSSDMMSLDISWTAPVTGAHGGDIDPKEITYQIYRYNSSGAASGWQLVDETAALTYTFNFPDDEPQDYVQLGVLPCNSIGDSGRIATVQDIMGPPYKLPLNEDFESNAGPAINPWIIYSTGNGKTDWGFGPLSQFMSGGKGNGIICTPSEPGTSGRLGIPRFSTSGVTDISFTLELYGGPNSVPATIYGLRPGMDSAEKITEMKSSSTLEKVIVTLPEEWDNQGWIQLYLEATFPTEEGVLGIESLEITGNKSGVTEISYDSEAGIYHSGKEMVFKGLQGETYCIFSASGIMLSTGVIESDIQRIPVPEGIIIARAGSYSLKTN